MNLYDLRRAERELAEVESLLKSTETELLSLTIGDHPSRLAILETRKSALINKYSRLYHQWIDQRVAEVG